MFKNEGPTNIEIKEINIDSHTAQLFAIKEKPFMISENITYTNGLSIKPGQVIFLELLIVIDYEGDIRASIFFEFAARNIIIYPLLMKGIPNEYGLTPIYVTGMKTDQLYKIPIEIKNPTVATFRIEEVKSSFEAEILKWPNGVNFSDKQLQGITEENFLIHANSKKVVFNIHFTHEMPVNIFDVIKINSNRETMAIPVLLQTTKSQINVYPASLNFGIISKDRRSLKAIPLSFFNESNKSVQILSISTEFDDKLIDFIPNTTNDFYKVDNHSVKPNSSAANIGHIILDTSRSNLSALLTKKGRRVKGIIIIRLNSETQSIIKVPYQYFIDDISIVYLPFKNFFHINRDTNLYNLKMYFKMDHEFEANFNATSEIPVVAKVRNDGQGVYCLNLSFKSVALIERPFFFVHIKSEAMLDSIPIHFYDDTVTLRISEIGWAAKFPYLIGNNFEHEIDIGVFGHNQPSSRTIELTNKNPYKVIVSEFRLSKDFPIRLKEAIPIYYNEVSHKELLSNTVETNKELKFTFRKASKSDIDKVYIKLLSGTKMLIDLDVPTNEVDRHSVDLMIELGDPYLRSNRSIIKLTLNFKVATGSVHLSPSLLRFEPAFPGMIQKKRIMSKSTFFDKVKLESVKIDESSIKAELLNEVISTKDRTELLEVVFNPSFLGNSVYF